MLSIVPVESERFENMERVADMSMRGFNPTQISKELNIPRKEVMSLMEDYRTALANDGEARDMARDHLNQMGKHYDKLIKNFYDLIDEIDTLVVTHQTVAQKNAAYKAIADLEAKRLDAYQKAGMYDSAELGAEVARWEEEKELMLSVLKDLCPVCQPKIAHRIAKLNGDKVPGEEVVDVEVVNV